MAYVGLLSGLIFIVPKHAILANATAYAFGTAINYVLNYYWSFTTKRSHAQASWRYLTIAAVGASFNLLYVAVMAQFTAMPIEIVGLSFAVVWPIISFISLKFWALR